MFRVIGGKYSNLIDMRELEATMSGHSITMIARDPDRLLPLRESTPVGGPFAISLPSKRIFVLSRAQRLAKMAGAA
ncbi:hypothetical protein [Mesorhizobium sp. M0088]|uniref:hypothetical protein n=1 Tax=Mesorhizobium sp. M0088 TaxID=2956873 RepID=UPI0033373E12